MKDGFYVIHYDKIQDFICGKLADETYCELCEQELWEELA